MDVPANEVEPFQAHLPSRLGEVLAEVGRVAAVLESIEAAAALTLRGVRAGRVAAVGAAGGEESGSLGLGLAKWHLSLVRCP